MEKGVYGIDIASTFWNGSAGGVTFTTGVGGTTLLSANSAQIQVLTGSGSNTYYLPQTSTLTIGQSFCLYNLSTTAGLFLQTFGGAANILGGTGMFLKSRLLCTCISNADDTTASWVFEHLGVTTSGSSGPLRLSNGGTGQTSVGTAGQLLKSSGSASTGAQWLTSVPIANGGTGQTTQGAAFNALSPMTTGGDLIYGGSSGVGTRLANGTAGQRLTSNGGTAAPSWTTPTSGTVTSVATSNSATVLSVSGGPITSSGTLAVSYSGTALPLANGGTSATTKSAAFNALSPMTTGGDLIYGGASGTGTRLANGTSGQVLKSNGGTAAPSWATISGAGTVTSVDTSNSASILSITGGPITAAGTLAVSYSGTALPIANGGTGATTQSTALSNVLGSSAVPIANGGTGSTTQSAALTAVLGSSVIPIANGGTNQSSNGTAGQRLTSDGLGGTSWTTPTVGTVTSVDTSNSASVLTVSGGPITSSGTLAVSYSGTALPVANGGTGHTSVVTAPTASTISAWDANVNLSASNILTGTTATVSSGGNTLLTVNSTYQQILTGSSNHTYYLPQTSTLVVGQSFYLLNLTSTSMFLQTFGGTANLLGGTGVQSKSRIIAICISTADDTAASWALEFAGFLTNTANGVLRMSNGGTGQTSAGTAGQLLKSSGSASTGAQWLTTVPIANGGTNVTSATTTPTASSFAAWDANLNLSMKNPLLTTSVIALANSTSTLTSASNCMRIYTGSTAGQVVVLPTTGIIPGQYYIFKNTGSVSMAIQSSDTSALTTISAGTGATITCITATPTTPSHWTLI